MSTEWLETAWHYTKEYAGDAWEALSNGASFLRDEISYGWGYFYSNALSPLIDILSTPDSYSWLYDHVLYYVGWLFYLNATYHPIIVSLRNALMFALTLRLFSKESSTAGRISMAIMMAMYIGIVVLVVQTGIDPVVMTEIAGLVGIANIFRVAASIYNKKIALNNFKPGNLDEKGKEITLDKVELDYFASKRSMAFAVMNLIGVGLMLSGYIYYHPYQVFYTTMAIFANSIFEFIDRNCDYFFTKSIGRKVERICCCCFGAELAHEEPGSRVVRSPSQSYLAINGQGNMRLPVSSAVGVDQVDDHKVSASGRRADKSPRPQPGPARADTSARQDARSPNRARVL